MIAFVFGVYAEGGSWVGAIGDFVRELLVEVLLNTGEDFSV